MVVILGIVNKNVLMILILILALVSLNSPLVSVIVIRPKREEGIIVSISSVLINVVILASVIIMMGSASAIGLFRDPIAQFMSLIL